MGSIGLAIPPEFNTFPQLNMPETSFNFKKQIISFGWKSYSEILDQLNRLQSTEIKE